MPKHLISALPELIEAGIINAETADAIEAYFEKKGESRPNWILIAFGILGALLTGLGIILIVAHNWDDFNQLTKTIIAFLPLLVGQLFAGFTILRKPGNVVWQEASAVFMIFALGACISLVSQIYHLLGDLSSFLFWWTLLSLPLMYLLRSSMASLLLWCGITYYGCQAGYFEWGKTASPWYWLFVLAALPYYYHLSKRAAASNFANFHHFLVPMSLVVVLGTEAHQQSSWMFLAYFSLFGLLHLVGTWIKHWNPVSHISGYQLAGKLGPLGLLMWFSFLSSWGELHYRSESEAWVNAQEFHLFLLLTVLNIALLLWLHFRTKVRVLSAFNLLPFVFALLFFIAMGYPLISAVLTNLLLLGIGIATVLEGSRTNSITTLNIGLLTLTGLLICRFFDLKIDFVVRGILFIIVGVGFFLGNYWLIKKKKV
ncbi:DUF2157 domain-containing protein [Haliscomenobacter sp.]|uniref:DUF2157 domain-containing protein n=1 Tax=Haliscomenobacter sp. TaxID=2717303 RepID=UPI0035944E88